MPDAPERPQHGGRFHNASLDKLYDAMMAATATISEADADIAEIKDEIDRRYLAAAREAYEHAGKPSGQLTLATGEEGYEIRAFVKKTVVWDSGKLERAATALVNRGHWTWEQVRKLFKITWELPEKHYGTITIEDEVRKAIDPARTVKLDPAPRLTLQREDD